ncbi:hypothetical protein [Pyxidicoccus caerfyrddinensis]|uniref:hypothetical protein n=1 Tax=Pyxidicoccus caerfyrddinensis TaxID=2709663 RepID=UPI0013DD28C2|nr:hypothetical protein [Pyxidicoccus caerfyrddinensis]
MNETVEKLVAEVEAIAQPRVALELQWGVIDDESREEYSAWVLDLHAIVEQPGRHHSQYSTLPLHRFPAEALTDRSDAHRIAEVVAERTHLALHAPPVEDRGGPGGSDWLRKTPIGPPVAYDCNWEASWWTDEGRREEARGREPVRAESGRLAGARLVGQLASRFPQRPLSLRVDAAGERSHMDRSVPYPAELPEADTIRALALAEACRASRIARGLPATSGLSLMLAFAAAFEGWPIAMSTYAPLAAWRRGELDDAALDDAVSPVIDRTRDDWDRPRRLCEVKARGDSVAAFIRNEQRKGHYSNNIQLVRALLKTFGLSLGDAKHFVYSCSDARLDAELDLRLEQRMKP